MKTKIAKATCVITKILEILFGAAGVGYVVFLALVLRSPGVAGRLESLLLQETGGELSVNGFDIQALSGGTLVRSAVTAFALAGVISSLCRTMIFRNVYLILKTAAGETWFSEGATPFQKDISRMVREIGIFYIMIPVLQTVISIAFRPIIGTETAEISVRMGGIVTGLVILALSQIFTYGEKLESEVEGLV